MIAFIDRWEMTAPGAPPVMAAASAARPPRAVLAANV